MRFRAGLIIGGAIGYVLGARAGRDRYQQIANASRQLRRHPAVSQLTDQAVGLVDAGRHAVAGGLSASGKGLRAVADQEREPDPRVP